jgi:hypothetical protein
VTRFVVSSPVLEGWRQGVFSSENARSQYFREGLIRMQREVLALVEQEGVPVRMSVHWEFRTENDVFVWNPQRGVPPDAVELVVVAEVQGFKEGS